MSFDCGCIGIYKLHESIIYDIDSLNGKHYYNYHRTKFDKRCLITDFNAMNKIKWNIFNNQKFEQYINIFLNLVCTFIIWIIISIFRADGAVIVTQHLDHRCDIVLNYYYKQNNNYKTFLCVFSIIKHNICDYCELIINKFTICAVII